MLSVETAVLFRGQLRPAAGLSESGTEEAGAPLFSELAIVAKDNRHLAVANLECAEWVTPERQIELAEALAQRM